MPSRPLDSLTTIDACVIRFQVGHPNQHRRLIEELGLIGQRPSEENSLIIRAFRNHHQVDLSGGQQSLLKILLTMSWEPSSLHTDGSPTLPETFGGYPPKKGVANA